MRRPASSAVVIPAMVAMFVAVVLTTSAGAAASSYSPSSYSERLLALVNGARQDHGLSSLQVADGVTAVAAGWTQQLADARALSHNPDLAHQLSTHGSSSWQTYGENVGTGSAGDPDGLFAAYMKSPEHRANILNSAYRFVGVDVVFTGARAWNTFDFVDAYGATRTATHHPAQVRPQPQPMQHRPTAGAASQPVAATPAATPRRVQRRTSRHPHRPAVRVEALHRPLPNVPASAAPLDATPTAMVPAAMVPTDGAGRSGSRRPAVVLAGAVLALSVAARRWILVVSPKA